VGSSGPWDEFDAVLHGSTLVAGRLVTSAHPEGAMQLRVDPRLRRIPTVAMLCAILILATTVPIAAAALTAAGAVEIGRGLWRVGPRARRAVHGAAQPDA
jgi:hypothetical protein